MKLTNEFTVEAPLEQTWAVLLDVPRVAQALPGASLEPADGDGSHRGTMKVRLGPVTTEYRGTARLQDVDDDEHSASFHVQGREARGHGTAAATIRCRLTGDSGRTHVRVETDLQVTGRQAQLGGGLMQDVAGAMLGDFSSRLERELSPPAEPEPAAAPREAEEEALDLTPHAAGAVRERAVLVAAGGLLGLVLGWVVWGRR